MKGIVTIAILVVAFLGAGCSHTGTARCNKGGCTVTHPDNPFSKVFFNDREDASCKLICNEIENCTDGKFVATVERDGDRWKVTGTDCRRENGGSGPEGGR